MHRVSRLKYTNTLFTGEYLGEHWDMSPLGAEGAVPPWSAPSMEKLLFGFCAFTQYCRRHGPLKASYFFLAGFFVS